MAESEEAKNQEADKQAQPAEPSSKYPIETADEPATDRSWPMLAALAIAALAFATLVVLAGRWAYHHWHHEANQTVATTQGQRPNFKDQGTSSKTNGSGGGSNSSSGKGAGTNGSNQKGPVAEGVSQLPNNGPGDVIALFIGSSALAASLHYGLNKRRHIEKD